MNKNRSSGKFVDVGCDSRRRHCALPGMILLAVSLSCPAGESTGEKDSCSAPVVKTTSGPVCGKTVSAQDAVKGDSRRSVYAYLGVPYGAPTAGPGRWRAPQPVHAATDVRIATHYGPVCPQSHASTANLPQSEDCLSLNIWAPPASAGKLPVMVFIYGGSFLEGSSSLPMYDGAKLAATDRVIIVSLNYRTGALGFLAGMDGLKGNYGFQDQRLALRWVRDNIAAFGGDPRKVTLFGQSAGAMSVGVHLIAPGSRDLFRAAIMESNPYALPYKRLSEAEPMALTLRELLGCTQGGLDCMRQRPFEDVVKHQHGALLQLEGILEGFTGYLVWAPVLDEEVFTEQPVTAVIDKPVIIGTNRNEGMLFAATSGIASNPAYEAALHLMFPDEAVDRVVARERYRIRQGDNLVPLAHLLTDYLFTCANRHVMRQAGAPVYGYLFNHVPSFPVWPEVLACTPARGRVCHADELPFVFSQPVSLNLAPDGSVQQYRFSTEEQRLASQIADFWLSFAEAGKPVSGEGPTWQPHIPGGALQVLDVPVSSSGRQTGYCDFWDTIGYERRGLMQRLLNRWMKFTKQEDDGQEGMDRNSWSAFIALAIPGVGERVNRKGRSPQIK